MNQSDNRQMYPAVPPLYPMDPCGKKPYMYDPILDDPYYGDCYGREPIYYEPYPIQEPIYYEPMPHDPYTSYPYDPYMDHPMMDPHFMECMKVCMRMRCGKY